jgi:putative SOS response-associated peptidase YedK
MKMCFRTKLNSRIRDIEKTFNSKFLEPEAYTPQQEINAFNFAQTPVITDENHGEIQMLYWGLIPFWAKDDKIKKMTLNARLETVTEKPAFKASVANRCLIIADGFYEWQWKDSKGKEKQKYLIHPREQEIFAFAGIYSTWTSPQTGHLLNSYSILTTEANDLMSEIHNNKKRMPVILRKEDHNPWLKGMEITSVAFPYEVALEAQPV